PGAGSDVEVNTTGLRARVDNASVSDERMRLLTTMAWPCGLRCCAAASVCVCSPSEDTNTAARGAQVVLMNSRGVSARADLAHTSRTYWATSAATPSEHPEPITETSTPVSIDESTSEKSELEVAKWPILSIAIDNSSRKFDIRPSYSSLSSAVGHA